MREERIIHKGWSWYEVVKDDLTYNFVAVAYTPWHALSIDALILYVQSIGIEINAAIIITAHPITGYAVDESFFTNKCTTFYYDENVRDTPCTYKEDKKKLQYYLNILNIGRRLDKIYFVTNSIPYLLIVRKIHDDFNKDVIISYSEEGVASYMGTISNPNDYNKKGIKGIVNYIRYQLFENYVYQATHRSLNFKIFKQRPWGLSVHKEVLPYYVKAIESLNKQKGIQVNKREIENTYIICTTAWQRDQINDDEDLIILQKVCEYLHQQGKKVLIKTHPRDSFFAKKIDQLNASLLNENGLPMECICAECKPLGIISFSSTILVTANVFWNIPTYCLTDLLESNKIGEVYLTEAARFKRTFEKFTHFVKSIDEIQ